MIESTVHESATRELFLIEKGPNDDAIARAKASTDRGDATIGHKDRELAFVLIPQDGEEPFTATLVSRKINDAENGGHLIYGTIKEARSLALRANYRTSRGEDGEFGTIEEVDD